jgi:hypothetical protein
MARSKADWVLAESADAMPSGRYSKLGKLENVVHRAGGRDTSSVQAHECVGVPGHTVWRRMFCGTKKSRGQDTTGEAPLP